MTVWDCGASSSRQQREEKDGALEAWLEDLASTFEAQRRLQAAKAKLRSSLKIELQSSRPPWPLELEALLEGRVSPRSWKLMDGRASVDESRRRSKQQWAAKKERWRRKHNEQCFAKLWRR
ncbi:hypothetical protein NL676_003348 [Syzygium grande]|nr:hypothetical protein NL676_003348 [Syzygium grande]